MFRTSDSRVTLSTGVPLEKDGEGVSAEFVLEEGCSQIFILLAGEDETSVPAAPSEEEAENMLQKTVKFWQSWLSNCTLPRPLARPGLPVSISVETSNV